MIAFDNYEHIYSTKTQDNEPNIEGANRLFRKFRHTILCSFFTEVNVMYNKGEKMQNKHLLKINNRMP